MKPKDYAKDTYLQQQRQNNQSKVGVGMNREDVLQLLGPPDFAGAALLNNAEPFCVWLYPAMPHSDKQRDTKYRSLEVTTSFAHRVIAVQSADLLSIDSEAFTGGKQ